MAKFKQVMPEIEAVQFTGENHREIEIMTGMEIKYDQMGQEQLMANFHGLPLTQGCYVLKERFSCDLTSMVLSKALFESMFVSVDNA